MKRTIFWRLLAFLLGALCIYAAAVSVLQEMASPFDILLPLAVTFLACLPLAVLFSRKIAGAVADPIQRITNHLEMIQRGNYNLHIDYPYDYFLLGTL